MNKKIIDRLRKMLQATGPYGNASVDQFNENYFRNAELKNTESARPTTDESTDNRKCNKTTRKETPNPNEKHEYKS